VDILLSSVKHAAAALRAFSLRPTVIAGIDMGPIPLIPTERTAKEVKAVLNSEYTVMSAIMCGECVHEGLKMDDADPNEEEYTMHKWTCAHGECVACMDKTAKLHLPPS
jgi:hypothetical protein